MAGISNFLLGVAGEIPKANLPFLDPVVGNLMKWMSGFMTVAVAVIVFTLLLKLITFPLDFISRRSMKISQLKMEKLAPQIEKMKKQYAGNKQMLNEKMAQLQRKSGSMSSMFASCIPTIITMVLFFYVFSAFSSFIKWNNINAYNELVDVYNAQTIEAKLDSSDEGNVVSEKEKKERSNAIVVKYESQNRNFLWIKNISVADVPWAKAIAIKPADYIGSTKDNKTVIDKTDYEDVMGPVIENYKNDKGKVAPNGFLILPIIAVGLSVLSQIVMMKTQKRNPTTEVTNSQGVMKIMMFMMPVILLIFALTSNSAFTIYMIINSAVTLLATLLINLLVEKTVKIKEEKEVGGGVGYRKDFSTVTVIKEVKKDKKKKDNNNSENVSNDLKE